MEIRVNPNAKKIIPAITVACALFFLFIAGNLVRMEIQYRDYVPVEATISQITQRRNNIGPTRKRQYGNYVLYQYQYNGQTYVSEERVFTRLGKEEGKTVKIKCSPLNPEELEDTYTLRILTLGSAVLLLCNIFLICASVKIFREKQKK